MQWFVNMNEKKHCLIHKTAISAKTMVKLKDLNEMINMLSFRHVAKGYCCKVYNRYGNFGNITYTINIWWTKIKVMDYSNRLMIKSVIITEDKNYVYRGSSIEACWSDCSF